MKRNPIGKISEGRKVLYGRIFDVEIFTPKFLRMSRRGRDAVSRCGRESFRYRGLGSAIFGNQPRLPSLGLACRRCSREPERIRAKRCNCAGAVNLTSAGCKANIARFPESRFDCQQLWIICPAAIKLAVGLATSEPNEPDSFIGLFGGPIPRRVHMAPTGRTFSERCSRTGAGRRRDSLRYR